MGIKITRAKPPQVATLDERLQATEGSTSAEQLAQKDDEAQAQLPQTSGEESAEAPAPRPLAKTSPSPYLGMTVLFRTQDEGRRYNGSDVHPAIITHVWSGCVNLKVIPDCGAPYDATSQKRIAYSDVGSQGWFTIDEARLA